MYLQHTVSDESYEKHSENFYQSKAKLAVRLFGSERHIRAIQLDRVLLQVVKTFLVTEMVKWMYFISMRNVWLRIPTCRSQPSTRYIVVRDDDDADDGGGDGVYD